MRAFACPACREFTAFDADRCANCQTPLGFHLPTTSMVAVADGTVPVDGQQWVRCTQHQTLGCNWLAPAEHDEFKARGRCLAAP